PVHACDHMWRLPRRSTLFPYTTLFRSHFNGGVWRELEENVRDWARKNERLFIVTGPVIGNSRETIGQNKVTVPEAFFKVLLDLRSEEHTSELQSRENLVCRLLLEKKKK